MLKRAGFKKKDLKSKETALAIYEILLREVEYDALQATRTIGIFGRTGSNNLNSSDLMGRKPLGTNLDDSRVMSIHGVMSQQELIGAGMSEKGMGLQFRTTSLVNLH